MRNAITGPDVHPDQAELDLATIDPAASPLSVRTANLDRVVAALEAAQIPYFRTPVGSRLSLLHLGTNEVITIKSASN